MYLVRKKQKSIFCVTWRCLNSLCLVHTLLYVLPVIKKKHTVLNIVLRNITNSDVLF